MLKKYVKLLLLVLASITYVGCTEEPYEWAKGVIIADNIEVSDISINSAKLSFDLKVGNDIAIEQLWIECKIDNKIKAKVDVTPVINGRCDVLLSNLIKDSSYDINIYATIAGNSEAGAKVLNKNLIYLRTLNPNDLMPVPSSLTFTSNTQNSNIQATCNLTIHENDLPVIEAGFFYGSSSTTTYETGKRIVGKISENNLTASISDLETDATYYIGAYVTTTVGTITLGPQSVKTGGVHFKMAISDLEGRNRGFNCILELSGIPKDAKLDNIIVHAARLPFIDLYGKSEVDWDLSTFGIEYTKNEIYNIYKYDLKKYNLTNTDMQSDTEYLFWFTIVWTDYKNTKHSNTMKREASWKVTTL